MEHIELQRGRLAVRVVKDLWQDPRILRYRRVLRSRLDEFRPDVVHVTSMGDFGLLGWRLAREFGLPIAASWHTNIYEYAAWRFSRVALFVPTKPSAQRGLRGWTEAQRSSRGRAAKNARHAPSAMLIQRGLRDCFPTQPLRPFKSSSVNASKGRKQAPTIP